MTGTCDTFKKFSFSVMQSAFRFSNVEILAVPTTSLIYNGQKLYIRLVVGTARISTLEKRNADCMTEKLNILKVSQVPVMHLLSLTTSPQLVTT